MLLKKYLTSHHIDRLLEVDNGTIYQLKQRAILDGDQNQLSEDELDLCEEFIDSIEMEERSLLSAQLEELRSIALFAKYPQTNGKVLSEQNEGD